MAIGPGIYDDICNAARISTNAEGVLLIIINGNKGTGFSCDAQEEYIHCVPDVLEDIAKGIRKEREGFHEDKKT